MMLQRMITRGNKMFRASVTVILLALNLAATNSAVKSYASQTRERRTRDATISKAAPAGLLTESVPQNARGRQSARVRQLATLTNTQKIVDIAFTTDGRFVAITSTDQTKRWWNVETGVEATAPNLAVPAPANNAIMQKSCAMFANRDPFLDRLPGGKELSTVSRSPDNKLLLTQRSVDGSSGIYGWFTLQIWDTATAQLRMTSEKLRAACAVYWSPDRETLIVVPYDRNQTRLVDALTGRVKAKLSHEGCTSDAVFGGGGCEPWVFSNDGGQAVKQTSPIKLWNAKTGELIAEFKNTAPPAVFSPTNSRVFATRSSDATKVVVWELL
jgi:WD40 repeat protein